eukprot:gene9196-9362_t
MSGSQLQVVLAIVVALGAGIFLHTNKTCLPDDGHPLAFSHQHLCTFTFITGGLTIPICAVVLVIELLPARLVSAGVRNVVPWLALLLGAVIWGFYAAAFAAIMDRDNEFKLEGWHHVSMQLAWTNMAIFLATLVVRLFSGVLAVCIDWTSGTLGRVCCPEGCLPACDACCCLDVRTAKVPREVLKHGRVVVRFMEWNQEANIVEPPMYR